MRYQKKTKRQALETLEIYAPLAHRLGIGELKGQLEDLSFPYVYPKEYQEVISQVKNKYIDNQKYLQKITPSIKKV